MTKTISIPFTDEQCQQIIQTWVDGPSGRVWCRSASADSLEVNLTDEGAAVAWELRRGGRHLRLNLDRIRTAIATLIASDSPGERRIGGAALCRLPTVDNVFADAIVQAAVFGKVVFG